jgi:hypothetical protein
MADHHHHEQLEQEKVAFLLYITGLLPVSPSCDDNLSFASFNCFNWKSSRVAAGQARNTCRRRSRFTGIRGFEPIRNVIAKAAEKE